MHDPHDITPLSPLSQSSSGYFSSSVSTVTLSDVLQPSSSSSSLLAAETALPTPPQQQQQQQQGADRNDVVTSPSQCGTKMAVVAPPAFHSSANHNNVTAENSFSEHKLVNSGRGGGGGGGEGFERLEIFVDDEERSHDDVLPDWLTEGTYVTVGSNKAGTVRYMGMTQFAEGVWVGVELDTPVGRYTMKRVSSPKLCKYMRNPLLKPQSFNWSFKKITSPYYIQHYTLVCFCNGHKSFLNHQAS